MAESDLKSCAEFYMEGEDAWANAGSDARNPYDGPCPAQMWWQRGYDAARAKELIEERP